MWSLYYYFVLLLSMDFLPGVAAFQLRGDSPLSSTDVAMDEFMASSVDGLSSDAATSVSEGDHLDEQSSGEGSELSEFADDMSDVDEIEEAVQPPPPAVGGGCWNDSDGSGSDAASTSPSESESFDIEEHWATGELVFFRPGEASERSRLRFPVPPGGRSLAQVLDFVARNYGFLIGTSADPIVRAPGTRGVADGDLPPVSLMDIVLPGDVLWTTRPVSSEEDEGRVDADALSLMAGAGSDAAAWDLESVSDSDGSSVEGAWTRFLARLSSTDGGRTGQE